MTENILWFVHHVIILKRLFKLVTFHNYELKNRITCQPKQKINITSRQLIQGITSAERVDQIHIMYMFNIIAQTQYTVYTYDIHLRSSHLLLAAKQLLYLCSDKQLHHNYFTITEVVLYKAIWNLNINFNVQQNQVNTNHNTDLPSDKIIIT